MTDAQNENPASPEAAADKLNPRPPRIALFCLLLVIALYTFSPLEDYDFWWHLKVGEIIYQTKDIVREDLFSFTSPGAYWIDHSWLMELVIFGAWQAGGVTGVLLLKTFLVAAAFLFLYGALCRNIKFSAPSTPGYRPLIILLVTAGAAAASKVGWEVRPQTFTYLFFTLFLFLLEVKKARYLLPLIMVLWANSHGSFFFGLVIAGAYTAEAWITLLLKKVRASKSKSQEVSPGGAALQPAAQPPADDRQELKNLSLLFLATLAASFINPHSIKLYTHPWIILHQVFPRGIAEWAPPTFIDAPAFWGFLVLTLLSLPLAVKKIRLAPLLLFLVFLYPGLRHLRMVPYLALAAAPLLAFSLAHSLQKLEVLLPRLSQPLEKPASQEAALPAPWLNPLYLISAALLIFLLLSRIAGWGGLGGINYQRFPRKAVDFYQAAKVPGPLFNTYDWGGYLTFRFWPQEKVFILGITSDEEVFRQFYHITEGQAHWRALLDKYRINAILTRTCYDEGGMLPFIAKLYLDPDWWLIYQDETAVLLVRAAENHRHLKPYLRPKENLFYTVLAEEGRLLQRIHNHPQALYFRALAYYMLGEQPRAQNHLKTLLRTNPAFLEAVKLQQTIDTGKNPKDFLRETYGR